MNTSLEFSIATLLALLLAACGATDGAGGPVAAKVNGETITVAQLGSVIDRNGNASAEQLKRAGAQTLESMIDQQLIIQKAAEIKLDRDPQVMRAMENARRQALAQAYMDKALAAVQKPTPDEIRAFFERNPLLFSQRRVFRFQELSAAVPDEKNDEFNQMARPAKTLTEFTAWFNALGIPYSSMESAKSAEDLPIALLPGIATMNEGQIAVLRSPGRVAVVQLIQAKLAPLDLAQASAQIEQYLLNGRRVELAKSEIRKLRGTANIEYAGEFEPTERQTAPPVK